jgi:hypothetical protein
VQATKAPWVAAWDRLLKLLARLEVKALDDHDCDSPLELLFYSRANSAYLLPLDDFMTVGASPAHAVPAPYNASCCRSAQWLQQVQRFEGMRGAGMRTPKCKSVEGHD